MKKVFFSKTNKYLIFLDKIKVQNFNTPSTDFDKQYIYNDNASQSSSKNLKTKVLNNLI